MRWRKETASMDIHADIIHKLQESNEILKEKYAQSHRKKEPFRQKLIKEADIFRQMQHINKEDLVRSLSGKKLAGTDGSVNQTKGESPHIIYLFQAVAKTTDGIAKWTSDLFVPLLEREEEEDGISKQRAKRLATLELNAARTLIEEEEVAVMLMDGALYHYRIDAKEEWEQLRQSALSRGRYLLVYQKKLQQKILLSYQALIPMHEILIPMIGICCSVCWNKMK